MKVSWSDVDVFTCCVSQLTFPLLLFCDLFYCVPAMFSKCPAKVQRLGDESHQSREHHPQGERLQGHVGVQGGGREPPAEERGHWYV